MKQVSMPLAVTVTLITLVAASLFIYHESNIPDPVASIPFFGTVLIDPGTLPDHNRTPGATNVGVTQDTIKSTICVSGWTATIRPPASYTTDLKKKQLASGYVVAGDTNTVNYEEDHLISLELGGNPTDPKNLWPQSYRLTYGAHQKDQTENYLKAQVCAGTMTLAEAQKEIANNWVAVYKKLKGFGSPQAGVDGDDE